MDPSTKCIIKEGRNANGFFSIEAFLPCDEIRTTNAHVISTLKQLELELNQIQAKNHYQKFFFQSTRVN